MTREEIYKEDRDEEVTYRNAPDDDEIPLPLTQKGFEALLQEVSKRFKTPTDDETRCILAGFIHHIPNERDFTNLMEIGKILRKSQANFTSWTIDQEIKMKRQKEAEEKRKAAVSLVQEITSADGEAT